MKLYNFFRSGSSHSLRIALRLKGLACDYVPVDLRAEQHPASRWKRNDKQRARACCWVQGDAGVQFALRGKGAHV